MASFVWSNWWVHSSFFLDTNHYVPQELPSRNQLIVELYSYQSSQLSSCSLFSKSKPTSFAGTPPGIYVAMVCFNLNRPEVEIPMAWYAYSYTYTRSLSWYVVVL
jgi:hypothetical protein